MRIFVLLSLFFSSFAYSDAGPYGLQIGISTVDDIKEKYRYVKTGYNNFTQGDVLELDVQDIKFDGLNRVEVLLGKDEKVVAIFSYLSKVKFNFLYDSLKAKYSLLEEDIPFVGNKFAKFSTGNTDIILNSPHLNFEMEMSYIDKKIFREAVEFNKKKKLEKDESDASQL